MFWEETSISVLDTLGWTCLEKNEFQSNENKNAVVGTNQERCWVYG